MLEPMANSSVLVLPRMHRAGRTQFLHCGRVVGRHVAFQDLRAGGQGHALDGDHILDRQRNAGQQRQLGRGVSSLRAAAKAASAAAACSRAAPGSASGRP